MSMVRSFNATENLFFFPDAIFQIQPHPRIAFHFACQELQLATFQGMLFTGDTTWMVPFDDPGLGGTHWNLFKDRMSPHPRWA